MAQNTQSRIDAARKAGLSDAEILQGMKDSPRYKNSFDNARKAGLSDNQIAQDLGLNIQQPRDLGALPIIEITAQPDKPFRPYDWKTEQNKAKREQARNAGPTKKWESALSGFSRLGAGITQGALYAKDALFGGNSYDKFTKERADINEFQRMRRQEHDQGFDFVDMAASMVGEAPLGALGKGFQGAKILSGQGAKILGRNAAVGAGIGGTGFAEDAGQRTANTVLGGIGGGAGAAAGEKIGRGVGKIVDRVTPSNASTQNIDDVIDAALKNSSEESIRGLNVTNLSEVARDGLRKEIKKVLQKGKVVDSQTVERMAVFNDLKAGGLDLMPTGKQATGNPNLWTKESELAKLDGGEALNQRYIQQNSMFSDALDRAVNATGGTSTSRLQTGESVIGALNKSDNAQQQIIKDLYQVAKDHTGNDLPIDPHSVVENARQAMIDNFINPDKAQTALLAKLKPFLSEENPKPFTLRDKELFVKQINSAIGKTTDGETRQALSLVRNALEEEVNNSLSAFGNGLRGEAKNAWEAAREAASQRFAKIERTPALKAALDDVAPDVFFEKFILSKSMPMRDVKALTNEIKDNPEAMNNLRLEIMRFIANNAVSNQSGAISPAGMRRAIDAIGDDKLKLFFNPDEVKHLNNLSAAAKYLYSQPMGSNVNNSNTSSALVNLLGYMNILKKVPVVGDKLNQVASSVPRSISAQSKLNQGATAISQTATPKPQTQLEQSVYERLVQAGLLGGANALTD